MLAAVCDLRVAAAGARFSIPEVELGIPLAWGGIPRLVREIGPALTKELVMTCREFGPDEAKAAGLPQPVVADEQLDDAVDELVATLVRMPKLALLATKAHTNAVTEAMVDTGRSWSDADGLLAGLGTPTGGVGGGVPPSRPRRHGRRWCSSTGSSTRRPTPAPSTSIIPTPPTPASGGTGGGPAGIAPP